ncbi:hypothetical protein ABZ479_21225 [Streptomyces sp. NPDC005722]
MDEATAVLLGAAVGAFGSLATGGFAWAAMRWQVVRQRDLDDRRWRRQNRRDAYVTFMAACRTATQELASAVDHRAAHPDDPVDNLVAAWQALVPMDAALAAVRLEAPDAVMGAAGELAHAVSALFEAAYPLRSGSAVDDIRANVRPAMDGFAVANRRFADLARADVAGPAG